MNNLKLIIDNAINFVDENKFNELLNSSKLALSKLKNKEGKGNDFLGWVTLPNEINKDFIDEINLTVNDLKVKSKILVVIGIGGSYLGAKAAISMFANPFKNDYEVIFAGHHLDTDYLYELLKYLEDKDFAVNVISKSGTTTEPAIAFRLLKELLIKKYGKDYKNRIIATTDETSGALRKLSEDEGYKSFVIPSNVGGRYSVLTPVGLLPIAYAGIDINDLIEGAKDAFKDAFNKDDVVKYCAMRNVLYNSGKKLEILGNYTPKLTYFGEWWKQLFGESEGKEGKGLFVSSVSFTTDLHSLGQYIQEGERFIFETIINVKNSDNKIVIKKDQDNLDGLNYLVDKDLDFVNQAAFMGTLEAHVNGNVPNIVIEIEKLDYKTLGYLFYFFEIVCGISGYVLDVNPFNQPGVEYYKKNMFKLLGKPGF